MKQEQYDIAIQEAWRKYRNDGSLVIMASENFKAGFMAGAEYRINSVWHTTADIPEKYKLCLVEYKDSDGKNKMRIDWRSEYEWVGMCHYDTILRWAYVSDLLPGGGAQ